MERFKNTIGILLTGVLIGLLAFVGNFIYHLIEPAGLKTIFAVIFSLFAIIICCVFLLEYFKFGEDERG
jgi:hypothetical protein